MSREKGDGDQPTVTSHGQTGGITAGLVVVLEGDQSVNRAPRLSPQASAYMHELTTAYVKWGFPNHHVWNFDTGADDAVHRELRALGLIKQMGMRGSAWVLTDLGQQCVMANRLEHAEQVPESSDD